MSQPRIGDTVHYTSYGTPKGEFDSVCRAAIVTGPVDEQNETPLMVANPTGLFFNICPQSTRVFSFDTHPGGTWHQTKECAS